MAVKIDIGKDDSRRMLLYFLVAIIAIVVLFVWYISSDECPDCNCSEVPECPGCELDCSSCPEKIVANTSIVEVVRYVCENGDVFDSKDDCFKADDFEYDPVMTNEINGTVIENVSVRPACVNGYSGGEIYFSVGTVPKKAYAEFKSDGDFETLYSFDGAYDGYFYFTVCSKDNKKCQDQASFYLELGKPYVFRLKFDQSVYNRTEYSNEHIVDARADGDYATKKC